MDTILSLSGLCFVVVSRSVLILLPSDKYALVSYSIFSIGIGLLCVAWYGIPIALVFSVTGIFVSLIIKFSASIAATPMQSKQIMLRFPAFRSIFLLLALSVSTAFFPSFGPFFQNPPSVLLLPSLFTIFLGLFHLGLTERPIWVALNLLTLFQAFALLYCWVELSILVVGLFAIAQLTLALTIAYLSAASSDKVVA
jgi:hypothetical protein